MKAHSERDPIAQAWHDRAKELAQWTMLRLVNRTDRYGGFWIDKGGEVHLTTKPQDGPKEGSLSNTVLIASFNAKDARSIVGTHALGPSNTGKYVAADIDAHPGTKADPVENERFAKAIYSELVGFKFRPLLTASNGSGGFHCRALFDGAVSGKILFSFGNWLVRDYKNYGFQKPPEVFPKQPALTENVPYGNWLRCPGRHKSSKREYWSKVWDGSEWLNGQRAIEFILALPGDPESLIPLEALNYQLPETKVAYERPAGPWISGDGQSNEESPFDAFNKSQTMESMRELLEHYSWEYVRNRGGRWDFKRPGTTNDKSGNLQLRDGIPIFFGFTNAAGITDRKGLSPTRLLCELVFSGDYKELAEYLRGKGFGSPRRMASIKITSPSKTQEGDSTAPGVKVSPSEKAEIHSTNETPVDDGSEETGKDPEQPDSPATPGNAKSKVASVFKEKLFDPFRLGRLLITRQKNIPTTLYYKNEWWTWSNGCYAKMSEDDFQTRAWKLIRIECERVYQGMLAAWVANTDDKKGEAPTVPKVSAASVSGAVKAAASMCHVPGELIFPVMLKAASDEPGVISPPTPDPHQRYYIALQNGLIDVKELRTTGIVNLRPLTPLYFTPIALPVSFDAEANCPKFLSFLAQITNQDAERQLLIQEMVGYLLTIDLLWHAFFFLVGDGGNGKSTLLAMIRALLGTANISSVALEVFGDRFRLSPTLGKLANIVEEVGEMDKTAEGTLKWYTGGSSMDFDRKNMEPVNRVPSARLVFATNTLPRFSDRTDGIWRRYFVVPFDVTIAKDKIVRGMDKPEFWVESGELSGILNWALIGLHRLHKQGGFTVSKVCEEKKNKHRAECNPHQLFLEDYVKSSSNKRIPTMELFSAYREWCNARNLMALGEPKFGEQVFKSFQQVSKARPIVGEKRTYCYVGIDWLNGRPNELLRVYDEKRASVRPSL